MAVSKNQKNLVFLKLQLLEDEMEKLYQGVDSYCNDVINKGAESISRRGSRNEAIHEFLVAYESTLRFMKEKIKQMEKYTRVPQVSQRVTKTGTSETQMFKVITNLETLRDLKCQFHVMIKNLLLEMQSMAERLIKNQNPNRLTNNVHTSSIDETRAKFNADRSDQDVFMENSIPRRASLDVRSSRDKQVPVFDSRRSSLDLRPSRDTRIHGFDRQRDQSQRFKSAFQSPNPRLATQLERQAMNAPVNDDLTRAGQDTQVSLLDLPKLSFADVNQHIESCLLFIMDIRLEFGDDEEVNIDDTLSIFNGDEHNNIWTSKSHPALTSLSQQRNSLGILEERVSILESLVRGKISEGEILLKTLPHSDAEKHKIPLQNIKGSELKAKGLEKQHQILAKDYEDNMPLVKKSIAMIVQEIEELNERFDSFKRIFAASKSINQRILNTIGRRVSDVEYKENSKRSSEVGRGLFTPEGNDSERMNWVRREGITLSDNGDDVFEQEAADLENSLDEGGAFETMKVKMDEEKIKRDTRCDRDIEENLLAKLKEETKKDISGTMKHMKEIDAKLHSLQEF